MSDLFQPDAPSKPEPTRFARVVLERGIDPTAQSVDSAFTYACDDNPLEPGQRVIVPLGRGDKPTAGIVTVVGGRELLENIPLRKIKPIARVTPVKLAPLLVKLAGWMSEYYVCPLGMVFSTMLPAAVKRETGKKNLVYLDLAPLEARTAELPKRLAEVWARVEKVDSELWPLTPKALTRWAEHGPITMASIKKLLEAGYLVASSREEVVESRNPFADLSDGKPRKHVRFDLTPQQAAARDTIVPTLGSFHVHLLHGVTGSGKTEVYLDVIERVLNADPLNSAIMLVPEIALTPQTAQRFVGRFGPQVAVLHSGLTATQRHAQWLACLEGRVRVVVGARSAIFAPLKNVGIIVVDEEHDSSYKQDQLPRYNGRDVAIKRAQLESCPCVLGSATPSLETWANARPDSGKYTLSTLSERVGGARMPSVSIVDLASERRLRALVQPDGWRDRHVHLIGPTLEQAIGDTLIAGGQVMLLLNRRGFANYICCTDPKCGWVMQCDHCDVTTVYHVDRRLKSGGYVRCHHCLAELMLPTTCPQCNKAINTFGLGTQRVEAELERKFMVSHGLVMGQTMLRLDGDSMQSARDYFNALARFASGEIKVLVGTQMIAKGLDYPNVRLVGVISADTSLNLPDFRAAERTFQLVAQVAGRAGRGEKPGRVIVQTMNPDEPAIVLAARHDFVRFAELELGHRRTNGLPPITKMARVVSRDEVLAEAQGAADAIARALRQHADELGVVITGPMPCAIARIGDHHRIAIELLASNRAAIQKLLARVRAEDLLTSDAHTAIDVDPIALL